MDLASVVLVWIRITNCGFLVLLVNRIHSVASRCVWEVYCKNCFASEWLENICAFYLEW